MQGRYSYFRIKSQRKSIQSKHSNLGETFLSTLTLVVKPSHPQTNLLCHDIIPLHHHIVLYLLRCLLLCVYSTHSDKLPRYSFTTCGSGCVFRWCYLLCGLVRLRSSNVRWSFIWKRRPLPDHQQYVSVFLLSLTAIYEKLLSTAAPVPCVRLYQWMSGVAACFLKLAFCAVFYLIHGRDVAWGYTIIM